MEALNEFLIKAVEQNNLKDIEYCVDNGANLNYIDKMKMSVLEHARHELDQTIKENLIEYLVRKGASVNTKTRCGQTEFMFLVYNGDLPYEFVVDILDKVDDINERNVTTGGTFLHLLTARPNDKGRLVLLQKLLDMGLCVNATDTIGNTPLHAVSGLTACPDSLAYLIDRGADVRAANRYGENVLHYLASANELDGFSECLMLILQKGVDINSVDDRGQTALHLAVKTQEATIEGIKELIKHGIKTNVTDKQGRNAIYHAVNCLIRHRFTDEQFDTREEIITLLADAGVDVNTADINGATPLHIAFSTSWSSMLCIIGCLIYNTGANPMARTNYGATPLHLACRSFNQTMVILAWYKKNGFDINVVDNFGSSALHWAVWFREISVARLLLQQGIDSSLKDKEGETAAQLARKVHLDNFIELVTNFSTPVYNDLDKNVGICTEGDPLFACKQLRFIRKSNGTLAVDEYIDHVKQHKEDFKSSLDAVLQSTNMGLFYDIEDNKSVADSMKSLIKEIQHSVSERNPLFSCTLTLAGSNFEGTKVFLPDEFDFQWKLDIFSEVLEPVESAEFPAGYIKLKLRDVEVNDSFLPYIDKSGELDSKQLLTDFYNLVNKETKHILVHNRDLYGCFICEKYLDELSCGIDNLSFCYYGRQAKSLHISVDIVPTIVLRDWKPANLNTDRILLEKLVQNSGFSVVLKSPDRLLVDSFSKYFRLSYASLEQAILSRVPRCLKMGYILLKSLFATKYCPMVVDHDNKKSVIEYITSYEMKTAFLFELEKDMVETDLETSVKVVSVEESRRNSLEWAHRILAHLESRIQNVCMPSYFIPNTNVFGIPVFSGGMTDQFPHAQLVALLRKLLDIYDDRGDRG